MALISEVITAIEAAKLASQYVDIEKEYVINAILGDIKKYAEQGKTYLFYSRQWVNEWFWADVTSYYCYNYFQRLGYIIQVEPNRNKPNDEICMIRW